MNKQLTKKTIGIAASAALMASLALTGNAFAAPPDKAGGPPAKNDVNQGDRTSIDVLSTCGFDANNKLVVSLTITDKNALDDTKASAVLASVTVQGLQKTGPREYSDAGAAWDMATNTCEEKDPMTGENLEIAIGSTCTIKLDVCGSLVSGAKAVDALTTVSTGVNGNLVNYYSQCKDSAIKLDEYSCQ